MRRFVVLAAIVLSVVVASAAPQGSLVLDQVSPRPGDTISFTVDVQNLPTNGGATISPWVEVTCGSVYQGVDAAISPVVPNTANPTRVWFTLSSPAWVAAELSNQSCEATLFYAGWNDYDPSRNRYPRPRKNTTLATIFFDAAVPE